MLPTGPPNRLLVSTPQYIYIVLESVGSCSFCSRGVAATAEEIGIKSELEMEMEMEQMDQMYSVELESLQGRAEGTSRGQRRQCLRAFWLRAWSPSAHRRTGVHARARGAVGGAVDGVLLQPRVRLAVYIRSACSTVLGRKTYQDAGPFYLRQGLAGGTRSPRTWNSSLAVNLSGMT